MDYVIRFFCFEESLNVLCFYIGYFWLKVFGCISFVVVGDVVVVVIVIVYSIWMMVMLNLWGWLYIIVLGIWVLVVYGFFEVVVFIWFFLLFYVVDWVGDIGVDGVYYCFLGLVYVGCWFIKSLFVFW